MVTKPKGIPRPLGAGRRKGVRNRQKWNVEQEARDLGMTPREFLLRVMNGHYKQLGSADRVSEHPLVQFLHKAQKVLETLPEQAELLKEGEEALKHALRLADQIDLPLRVEAAGKVAPFVHRRMPQVVEINNLSELSDDELIRLLSNLPADALEDAAGEADENSPPSRAPAPTTH
jgi:hypothetical protein